MQCHTARRCKFPGVKLKICSPLPCDIAWQRESWNSNVVFSNVLRTESKGWIWMKVVKMCESHVHWTTLSRGVWFVGVEMMHPWYTEFSSGYRLNKLGQVISPQNGGNDLAAIKLDKVKAAKLCVSVFFLVLVAVLKLLVMKCCSEIKTTARNQKVPLLSTNTTVGGCSILNWVRARTKQLNTFRTCVSKSSDASFSTMKRQNMNTRAGSLETTLLKRIMLFPTAIKNVKSSANHGYWERHSGYGYSHRLPIV